MGESLEDHGPASLAYKVRKKGEAGRSCPKQGGRQELSPKVILRLILAVCGIQMFEFTHTNAQTYTHMSKDN